MSAAFRRSAESAPARGEVIRARTIQIGRDLHRSIVEMGQGRQLFLAAVVVSQDVRERRTVLALETLDQHQPVFDLRCSRPGDASMASE